MTNDCKTCPVSTGTHKPAEAVHQIDEPQADALRLAAMTHHTDAELLRDIEEHMRKMWDARLLPAVCWPADLAQRLTQAVRRAPAAPVPQCPFPCGWQNLHALTVAEGAFLARSLNEDEPITAHQRYVVMRVVHYGIEMARTMLAAAPQPPEADHIPDAGKIVAAPVQLPEPWGVAVGDRIWVGKAPAHVPKIAEHEGLPIRNLYTEQQVRDLLAAHGIQEQST